MSFNFRLLSSLLKLIRMNYYFSFLNSIERVASTSYTPATDDILRCRLQTMGVASYTFNVQVSGKNINWHLYDVGGACGQRHTWVPYFDDANAIIFLAPVSAFDQVSFASYVLFYTLNHFVSLIILHLFPFLPFAIRICHRYLSFLRLHS